jgi:hypothetical protein
MPARFGANTSMSASRATHPLGAETRIPSMIALSFFVAIGAQVVWRRNEHSAAPECTMRLGVDER